LGFDRTNEVSLEDMRRHLSAVRRGAPETFIVCDLPYGSYLNEGDAISNAKDLIEAGADAVKPEGKPSIVKALINNGIEVMGHVGHLPQSEDKAKVHREWNKLLDEAKAIEEAGAFSIVLEMVQTDIAKKISEVVIVPTIGIGAGAGCDGQVLVLYDLIGLYPDFSPKFARKYLTLNEDIKQGVKMFSDDVKKGKFPSEKESFK